MTVRVHYISSHLMLFEDTVGSSVRISKHINTACGNNLEFGSVRAAVCEMQLPASLCLSVRLFFYPHRTVGIQKDKFLLRIYIWNFDKILSIYADIWIKRDQK